MLKAFNDFAKARFAQQMAEAYPEYRPKKSLRGPLAGALNFEYCSASGQRGWLSFGGFKESTFALLAAWSVDETELKSLEEWEQYPNPHAFDVPPVPDCGYVDLRDRWRFEKDGAASGAFCSLDIEDPPLALSTMVFDRYAKSPQCEEAIASQYKAVLRMYTKNPPSAEQHKIEFLLGERAYCVLWSHLATRHDFTEEELFLYLNPVVADAMELVHKYGIPLISKQLRITIDSGQASFPL